MTEKATSKHLRSATELQLLVPIRHGFVAGADRLTSYSARLKLLLEALSESFKSYWERDLLLPSGPIDQLQSIHTTQWAVHELPERAQLVVASCFDRSWEEYFHLLVDRTGHLLDAIFMHCENYMPGNDRPGRSCREGYEAFADFIREHQLQTHFFYMAAPDLNVDDVRRARKMLGAGLASEAPLGTVGEEAKALLAERIARDPTLRDRLADNLNRVLVRLLRLRVLFPAHETFGSEQRNAEETFDRAIASLLGEQLASDALNQLSGALGSWVTRLREYARPERAPAAPAPESLAQSTLDSIQGNILESYAPEREHVTHGCMVLVQCDDPAPLRALLTRLAPVITSAGEPPNHERARAGYLNVALTYPGLKRVLPEAAAEQLPKEFQEGMSARTGLMGDIGLPDTFQGWQLPERNWPPPGAPDAPEGARVALDSIDVVLLFQQLIPPERAADYEQPWSSQHPLYAAVQALRIAPPASDTQNGAAGGVHILHVQPLARGAESHFKLSERGVSQPMPCVNLERTGGTVVLHAEAPVSDHVPLGELLLGYRDNRGKPAEWAGRYPEYFKDGSFLVVRKLKQDVDAFRTYTERQLLTSPEQIKALIVGRDDSGNPLVNRVPSDRYKNDFTFEGDREGQRCPLHSHMRRTNPRPQLGAGSRASDRVPRILRRSFAYGPTTAGNPGERGLLFMAYNASIAGQFEVIQRWVNGGNSTGLASGQNDLLSGVPQPTGAARKVWDGEAWRTLPAPERPFVSLRWGLYLFVPSLAALRAMAQQPGEAPPPDACALQEQADALITRLNALPEQEAREAWKRLIEGEPSADAALIWQAARARARPIKAAHYGYLVANDELVNAILSDPGEQFSVREYYGRLLDTIGPHYLGFDPVQAGATGDNDADALHARFLEQVRNGDYQQLSSLPNQYIQQVLPREFPALFRDTHNAARAVLEARPGNAWTVNIPDLAKRTFAKIGHRVVGIPGDENERLDHFQSFILISRYAFQPYPDELLGQKARACRGPLYQAYLAKASGNLDQLPMLQYLVEKVGADKAITASMGALVGFAAPAVGCVVTAAGQLINSAKLPRLQLALENVPAAQWYEKASAIMQDAQARLPIPVLLYRTVTGKGPRDIPCGAKVIIGTQVAGRGGAQWLFGGNHGGGAAGIPPHGCPARNPALQIMSGFLAFLLRMRRVEILSQFDLRTSGALPDEL